MWLLYVPLVLGAIAIAVAATENSPPGKPMTGRRKRLALLRSRRWHDLSESERLELLSPDTQLVAAAIVNQLRDRGLDARLGETYRTETGQRKKFDEGKSSTQDAGWHTLGRAFHIIIVDPTTKKVDTKAYSLAGQIAREHGAIWKGDVVLHNKYGEEYIDLAHFEYHPQMTLAQARKAAGYA